MTTQVGLKQKDPFTSMLINSSMLIVGSFFLLQVLQTLGVHISLGGTPASASTESAQYAWYGNPWLGPAGFIFNMDYGEDGQPLYSGEALPGTRDDTVGWRIYKYVYAEIDGDLEVVKIRYAGGTTDFDKIWDDRASYEYS